MRLLTADCVEEASAAAREKLPRRGDVEEQLERFELHRVGTHSIPR